MMRESKWGGGLGRKEEVRVDGYVRMGARGGRSVGGRMEVAKSTTHKTATYPSMTVLLA